MKDKEKTKKILIEPYTDITDYKKTEVSEREYISEMKFLADTAMDFVEFPLEEDIFQYVGEKVQEIIGDAVVFVNEFDKNKDGFVVRYLGGYGKKFKKVLSIVGKDPANMTFKITGTELSGDKAKVSYEEGKAVLLSGKLNKWPGGFAELSLRYIPKSASQILKKLFNLNEVYMISLSRKGEILGEVVILLRGQNEIKNPDFIETFIKQAAIALQRKNAEEALRQSQQEFISIFRDNPEAIVYVDEKETILDINSRFFELFGYTLEEIKGKNINSGIIHPPEKIIEGKDLDNKALSKGYINFETIRKKKDSTLFPVSISGSPIVVNGRPRGMIGIFMDITNRKTTEEQLKESFKKLQKTMEDSIEAISLVTEARDAYTAGHQRKVSKLSVALAKEMGFPQDKVEGIKIAALIHDVGKINLPAEILSKPGKLSEIEFSLIKNHSQKGYEILKTIDFSWPVAEIVLQHHEKVNGSGYPRGLKGDEILLEAKIICVADVVEAMSSHRPYRPALGIDKALEEISQNRGIFYDPEVVDVCLKLFKEKSFKFES
ncbi:MAG: PAS domain S-box protein [Candidatus Atribacteria bacterium]|nr:PAS domain S-box protein [Candidatus Atribacteria bacterium]